MGETVINHVTIRNEKAFLELDKQTIQARLIIGADGANSWIRNELNFDCKVRRESVDPVDSQSCPLSCRWFLVAVVGFRR